MDKIWTIQYPLLRSDDGVKTNLNQSIIVPQGKVPEKTTKRTVTK